MSLQEIESGLYEIWKNILGKDNFTIEQDFYDIGGVSLQAFKMLAEIKKTYGVQIELMYILEDISIQSLAKLIENKLKNV
ncbi:acyl carrier protein [[Clostridium] polysaccharolyticum]|uniref:Phosphopantetheine attachment site n=1 Tax=[Clostridium] polysaccharolyticum TaxID=29364 RepID=A0A1I0BDU5_9FIRM|nr:phosphopantetheine-binding protein [[Clostridium] polysaccharolyticum]SET05013.1 Phosphopantetheine attachment site [[Clostridium] polysaccharolyticum]